MNDIKKHAITDRPGVLSAVMMYDRAVGTVHDLGTENGTKNSRFWCYNRHSHDMIELLYIKKGEMICGVGKCEMKAAEGDICVVNPFETHWGYLADGVAHIEYQCVTAVLPDVFENASNDFKSTVAGLQNGNIACDNFILNSSAQSETIRNSLTALDLMFSSCTSVNGKDSCLLGYMYVILGSLMCGSHIRETRSREKTNSFMSDMAEYIEENYRKNISSEDAAKHFSYNTSYFCRLFRQNFGTTFHSYLTEYRLSRAMHDYPSLMKCGEVRSIADIAAQTGFSDYNYFAKLFRKNTGMSPSEYFRKCADDVDK